MDGVWNQSHDGTEAGPSTSVRSKENSSALGMLLERPAGLGFVGKPDEL